MAKDTRLDVPFKNYILSLGSSGRIGRSKDSFSDSGEGEARLEWLSTSGSEEIEKWNKFKELFPEEDKSSSLWQYTLWVCMRLEMWWNTLPTGAKAGAYQFPENCDIPALGIQQGRLIRDSHCQPTHKVCSWDTKGRTKIFKRSTEEGRGLSICRELVYQVMLSFGVVNTDNRTRDEIKRKNPCMTLYRSLTSWGGKEIAKQIITDWFMSLGEGTQGGLSDSLVGTDLYEVLTEIVYGKGKGDKSFTCEKTTDEGEIERDGLGPFRFRERDTQDGGGGEKLNSLSTQQYRDLEERMRKEISAGGAGLEGPKGRHTSPEGSSGDTNSRIVQAQEGKGQSGGGGLTGKRDFGEDLGYGQRKDEIGSSIGPILGGGIDLWFKMMS
ncbi:hypothetical protein C922_04447 [Plasmodium inui San Antonio 1]|uniref:Uncharacterized protein n=1 Tax=Plasmodium inui San Antonio 1 TaxID=1237626 RepID=W7AIN9_9APIC|nr:hypothetical protein C922_04447 [Plasmodium inui San Antonio 1]EUD65161.1 hypothetical protein C922_04447 [Plasmodium inui San Antonio 1]